MPKVGGREQRDSGKLDPPFRGIRFPASSFILLTSVTKLRSNETNWLLCPRWKQCKVRELLTLHCAWGFKVTQETVFWVLLWGCFQRDLTLGGNTSPQRGQYSPMGRVPQWKGVSTQEAAFTSLCFLIWQPAHSESLNARPLVMRECILRVRGVYSECECEPKHQAFSQEGVYCECEPK